MKPLTIIVKHHQPLVKPLVEPLVKHHQPLVTISSTLSQPLVEPLVKHHQPLVKL